MQPDLKARSETGFSFTDLIALTAPGSLRGNGFAKVELRRGVH